MWREEWREGGRFVGRLVWSEEGCVCASASACMFSRAVPPKSRSSSSVRVRREISLLQKENDSLRSQVQGALGEGADGQNLVEGLRR